MQWNFDITKAQETRTEICSLIQGSIINFNFTGAEKIVRYTEDLVIWRFV